MPDIQTLTTYFGPLATVLLLEAVRYYFSRRGKRAEETSAQRTKRQEGDASIRLKEIDDNALLRQEMRKIEQDLRTELRAAIDDATKWRNLYFDERTKSQARIAELEIGQKETHDELARFKNQYQLVLFRKDELEGIVKRLEQERRAS